MKSFRFDDRDTPEQRTAKLNDFARTTSTAVSAMPATERIDVEFTGPAASLSLLTGATTEPFGVVLVYLRNATTNAAVSLADTFAWTFSGATGKGQIVTTSFSGLSAGTYRARLLIVRE